jgi:hypothetical protein
METAELADFGLKLTDLLVAPAAGERDISQRQC